MPTKQMNSVQRGSSAPIAAVESVRSNARVRRRRRQVAAAAIAVALPATIFVMAPPSRAETFTISSGSDSATIAVTSDASQYSGLTGVVSLLVNNQEQFGNGASQDYYYSTNNTTAAPIEDLTFDTGTVSMSGNVLTAAYSDPSSSLTLTLQYILTGGTNRADLDEVVTASLPSNAETVSSLTLLQYTNFHVGGLTDNTVTISGGDTADQTSGDANLADTVQDGAIDAYDADLASTVQSEVTNLDLAGNTSAGPGDVASGFQFAPLEVDPDGFKIISTTNAVTVPEPASALLMGAGVLLLATRRRNRQPLQT